MRRALALLLRAQENQLSRSVEGLALLQRGSESLTMHRAASRERLNSGWQVGLSYPV